MGTLRSLFRLATGRSRVEADVADELELHRTLAEEELLRQGVAPEEAARLATAELGDRAALSRRVLAIDRVRERRMRRVEVIGKWQSDLRLAWRGFRRDPWFTAVALLLVALGVGANVAVFAILNAAFFRALPFPDADRVVDVVETRRGRGMRAAGANLRDWQQSASDFTSLAGYQAWDAVLGGRDRPETVTRAVASRTFPDVVGIQPMLGRWFAAEEAVVGGAPVVVLSEGFWRNRFGADPGIVGTAVRVDGVAATVVGVMPHALDLPVGAQLWMPLEPWSDDNPSRTSHNWRVVGRLRPGVDTEAATRSLSLLTRQLVSDETDSDFVADGVRVIPIRERLLGQSPRMLVLLQGAVGLLLLVAVLNLTALLLARAAKRQGELVMIRTLGATRGDLVRRFVVESLLLAAGGVGLGLAAWLALRPALLGVIGGIVPFVRTLPVDGPFLAAVAGLVVAIGLLAGVAPALWAARSVERGTAVRESGRVVGPSRVLQMLIGVEVAATFVLLAGAGLLGNSLVRMLDQPLGFGIVDRIVIPLPLPYGEGTAYADTARRARFLEEARERVAAIPGVVSTALTTAVPLRGGPNGGGMIQGEPSAAGGPAAVADYRVTSPGFFEVLGTPVVRGRDFASYDGGAAPLVAIVNEAFARAYLAGADPIGRLVRMPGMDAWEPEGWAAVVGVVGDVRHDGPGAGAEPALYFPLAQRPQLRQVSIVARIRGAPTPILQAARLALEQLEPELPSEGTTFGSLVGDVVAEPRLRTLGLGAFAAAALLLAGVGLFGVIGFILLRRTREIGVRLALGAPRARVAGNAFGHALRPVLLGLAAGLVLAVLLGGAVRSFLFEIDAVDPATFAGAATLVLLVTAVACIGPIRRALAVDPATVLRADDAR